MTTTAVTEPIIGAKQWARREAACDAMETIAKEVLDATVDSAGWYLTGWGRSIVAGRDVRQCREFLTVRGNRARLDVLHERLTTARVISSTSWHGDRVSFWPNESYRVA